MRTVDKNDGECRSFLNVILHSRLVNKSQRNARLILFLLFSFSLFFSRIWQNLGQSEQTKLLLAFFFSSSYYPLARSHARAINTINYKFGNIYVLFCIRVCVYVCVCNTSVYACHSHTILFFSSLNTFVNIIFRVDI